MNKLTGRGRKKRAREDGDDEEDDSPKKKKNKKANKALVKKMKKLIEVPIIVSIVRLLMDNKNGYIKLGCYTRFSCSLL